MKKLVSLFFALSFALILLPLSAKAATVSSGSVKINKENFPDAKFRSYIADQDYGKDGELTSDELRSITYIDITNRNIKDLTGIEQFTALTALYCYDNPLTSIDVSKNSALEILYCGDSQLTSLNLSKNTKLKYLDCNNSQLTSLDVSKNTRLESLSCTENQLTSLDVSKNTALEELICHINQLTSLDLSSNTALISLWCQSNQLESLDVSKNTRLEELYCYNNQLTSLKVGKNSALSLLWCGANQLTSLDVSGCAKLIELSCAGNLLKNLDVSKNTALKELRCGANQLTSLDVRKNTRLESLSCAENQLTSLDVRKNTALKELWCDSNQLTSLDVRKNTKLTLLDFVGNQLTSIDVSKNTALETLVCQANQLTSLDVRKNTKLAELICYDNQLRNLDVRKNPALTELICYNNQLTELDISKNTALTYLWCQSNQLTELDISKNTALTFLWCQSNRLAALDVSKNTALETLRCEENSRKVAATGDKVDLSILAEDGFDVSKASNWKGGKVSGNTLSASSSKVTYTYNLGNGKSETFTLRIVEGPSAPVLTATNVSSTGKIKLSWTAVDGAAEYELYRSTSKNGTYSRVTTTVNTSVTNVKTDAGKTYYYKIRSVDADGMKSGWSAIVSRACDLAQPVVKTSNVASSGKIKVTWEKVEGAKEYQVYRATSEDGEYKLMKTTTSTSYTNTSATAGKPYYYKVVAIHSKSSANSAYSEVVSRTCDLAQPVVTLSNVASSGKIKLTWEEVEGAAGYKVFRATSKSGTYKELAEITDTSYTDISGTEGKTYYYEVQALHIKSAANSTKSSAKYRTCDLPRPDVTVTVNSNGDAKISFVRSEDAEKYEIYRATSKNGEYTKIKTLSSSSAYTDTSVKAGKTYYYKVKAIHSNSAANSAYSSVDSIKAK